MLFQNVNLHPDGAAFKYVDYGRDWDGIAETVTWYQLYRRMVNVALEIRRYASPGDRAVILIPQSMDYIYAFLGAMQAGVIGVPLSLPMGGATDERVDAVLLDAVAHGHSDDLIGDRRYLPTDYVAATGCCADDHRG